MAGDGPKRALKNGLRRAGLELRRYDSDGTYAKRRQGLLESQGVDLVLDVGAHAGEFGQSLRHDGYAGRILSFEPLAEHHEVLQALSSTDGRWECRRIAIGDSTGPIEINVSGNDGYSSSVREMTARHETGSPTSAYVSTEQAEMTTLDLATDGTVANGDRLFLKVDTQGYEQEVLDGAGRTLERCRLVELELGFVELYADQALFTELVETMRGLGMILTDLEPGFRDERSGELLQVDALFIRRP